ncbi:sugar nucleotide-binding protein [Chloroflexi bacterium TSY]|nr:sugar nucleotide-binding protein [Chloroflexi bacterium TSY]
MDKKILVIGSSGYLGQMVTKMLGDVAIATHRSAPKFHHSLPYDFYQDATLPLADLEMGSKMVVIFTAAVEMNKPADIVVDGMQRLLNQLRECRFIYLSSDAVFSGEKGNYAEHDSPQPLNDYGRNLVLCEELVQGMISDSCIIRPSYIYGFVGGELDTRLSQTRDKLLHGEIYIAYNDYYKSPLSVHQVADAVVRLAESDYTGPIHVAGPKMSVYEFQRRAMLALNIDISGLQQEPMPNRSGLMRDTSLNSSRWWAIRDAQPITIETALQINCNRREHCSRFPLEQYNEIQITCLSRSLDTTFVQHGPM